VVALRPECKRERRLATDSNLAISTKALVKWRSARDTQLYN
jgi:hypothetical protein